MFFIKLFGKVYDVSNFVRQHPGGEDPILIYCSPHPINLKDRKEEFLQFHGSTKILKSLPIVKDESKCCSLQ